jgi:DNA-binding NarL/FixJ family response regulator
MEVEQKEKDRIDWRRGKVHELSSQGYSQREIAQILQISNGTVNKDTLTSGCQKNMRNVLLA